MSDLLTTLADQLGAEQRHDRRYHADCPFCGKEAKRGQKHFSFVAEGYVCWVCGAQGGLRALAERVGAAGDAPRLAPRRAEPAPPRRWQLAPDRYVQAFYEAPTRLPDWQRYKPLSIDTIARYRLGVGVLPSSRCDVRRLIVPVFHGGQVWPSTAAPTARATSTQSGSPPAAAGRTCCSTPTRSSRIRW